MRQRNDRVAVITGASSGIGLVTAKELASHEWTVIAVGRDPERCAAAKTAIEAVASAPARVHMLRADLAILAEAVRLGGEISQITDCVDILINNAGGVAAGRKITPEGNEATFASNHLGPFILTDRLLPLLHRAAALSTPGQTRIIITASSAHEATPGLNWDDLQSLQDFDANRAYCNAKLANVLYAKALAKRLEGTGIVVHALHPGAVDTRFFSHGDEFMQEFGKTHQLLSVEDGADTLIWLATSAEGGTSSGEYFHQRQPLPVSPFAADEGNAKRLWSESEKLAASSLESTNQA